MYAQQRMESQYERGYVTILSSFWAETNKVKRLNLLSNVIMYTYDKETEVLRKINLFFCGPVSVTISWQILWYNVNTGEFTS